MDKFDIMEIKLNIMETIRLNIIKNIISKLEKGEEVKLNILSLNLGPWKGLWGTTEGGLGWETFFNNEGEPEPYVYLYISIGNQKWKFKGKVYFRIYPTKNITDIKNTSGIYLYEYIPENNKK